MSTMKRRESAVPGEVWIERDPYPRCHWEGSGMRCKYPGTITHSVQATPDTPWFCSAHYGCDDPVLGGQIMERSQSYVWVHPRDRYLRPIRKPEPVPA